MIQLVNRNKSYFAFFLLALVVWSAYLLLDNYDLKWGTEGVVTAARPAQEQTVPQAEQLQAEIEQFQREHRPVVVEYLDSTFEGRDRAGFRSENADYYIAVSYVTEEQPSELPADQKRLVVTTSLGNPSGAPITIEPRMLTLVSSTGERYEPVLDEADSELLGKQLNTEESLYGFVGFNVPADFAEGTLEWCLDGSVPCAQAIDAPLP